MSVTIKLLLSYPVRYMNISDRQRVLAWRNSSPFHEHQTAHQTRATSHFHWKPGLFTAPHPLSSWNSLRWKDGSAICPLSESQHLASSQSLAIGQSMQSESQVFSRHLAWHHFSSLVWWVGVGGGDWGRHCCKFTQCCVDWAIQIGSP